MPQGDFTTGQGLEFTCTVAPHDKYWQVICAGNVVVTRYGRRGSLGLPTVHHQADHWAAIAKKESLVNEKMRKGYVGTARSAQDVTIPTTILTVASSATSNTGRGGSNPHAGYALIAYYVEAAKAAQVTLKSGDLLVDEITTGHLTPRRVALAALAGYKITDKALTGLDDEDLAVMAGFISLNENYNISSI